MATIFVTGSNQSDLAANITSDIAAGKLDLTIYSVTPAVIGSNLDNLIPNLSLLRALRFSDVNNFPDSTFFQANLSDLVELSGNCSLISGNYLFGEASMPSLTSISFPNLTSITGRGLFSQAHMSNVTSISFPNLVSILNADTFAYLSMPVLTNIYLPKLQTISVGGTFYSMQLNLLTTLNLPNLTSISGFLFGNTQMNSLTSISWSSNLSSLPAGAFNNTSVPKLSGICLGKVTTFTPTSFQNITHGPSDMKALSVKTHSDLVYASDFYGYACTPLIFNIPVGNSDNVFNTYTYKNFGGTTATGLTVTAVNELTPPVTIGGINFQPNGTITVNSDVPNITLSMRFSAAGGLIGARSVKIKPCFFTLSDVNTKGIISGSGPKFTDPSAGTRIEITGFQKWNRPGTRTVTAALKNQTQSKTLSSDGPFKLVFPFSQSDVLTSDTITLSLSGNNACPTTFTSNYVRTSTLFPVPSLKVRLIGSLFDFLLTLPSDFNSQASDKNGIFSDICAFAQTKPFNHIPATFETLENSDMFASDAVIATGIHNVFVSCVDQCLNINETSDLFAFRICSFTSDAKVNYSDANPANTMSDVSTNIPAIANETTASASIILVETASSMPCDNILSDIQFSALSSDHFQITGYQLDDHPEIRVLSASYMNETQTKTFSADGFFYFDFTNTSISDGLLLNITAQGNNCKAVTSTFVTSFSTSDCIKTLSNIEFVAFSANAFKITGHQAYNRPGTRSVSVSYMNASDQTQSFNSDGFFQFIFTNTAIIDGEQVMITTKGSDCALTFATVTTQSQNIAQGTMNLGFSGSLLNFNITLPPELAITLPITNDVHAIFSDMRAFAQIQDCQQFLAGIVINAYSDLFCSDALIVQHPEIIVVSCSDNVLNLDDDDGRFIFSITNFMSDFVFVQYSDALCQISDVMSLIGGGFSLQTSDTNFIWVSPCDSDLPNVFTNVFNHPILAIDAQGDVVDIGLIDCSGPCHNPTSDLLYVSRLRAATLKLGQYLSDHHSDYTSKISDQCHVMYTGPITAVVTLDFHTARLIYHKFSIPFSDVDVC